MKSKAICFFVGVIVMLFASFADGKVNVVAGNGVKVIVIAPTAAASQVASDVLRSLKYNEVTNANQADGVLVVIRSNGIDPLMAKYESMDKLSRAANLQCSLSFGNYHVYEYQFNGDGSLSQRRHTNLSGNDSSNSGNSTQPAPGKKKEDSGKGFVIRY